MALKKKKILAEAEQAVEAQRLEEAEALFGQILAEDAKHIEALFNRALVRQRMKRFADALTDIERLIELRPENSIALMLKGEILLDQNKAQDAYDILLKACELEKDNGRAFCSLGLATAALGKKSEAVDYFEQALHFEQHYTLARVFADLLTKNSPTP